MCKRSLKVANLGNILGLRKNRYATTQMKTEDGTLTEVSQIQRTNTL